MEKIITQMMDASYLREKDGTLPVNYRGRGEHPLADQTGGRQRPSPTRSSPAVPSQ